MKHPIVIINPLSGGSQIAPAFNAQGIPCIAVTLAGSQKNGFGNQVKHSDFIAVIPYQDNIVALLKKYDPLAIIPGTEEAIIIAETLTMALTPQFANAPDKLNHRLHKALMQEALALAGLPTLKTYNTANEQAAEAWISAEGLNKASFIMKPPMSAGSDKVFHISPEDDWKIAFKRILDEPSKITGKRNSSVVIQEEAIGTEFAIGTVSAHGQHSLVHLIQYHKSAYHGRKTIYDYVEFIPFCKEKHESLWLYTQQVLDALGVRWGASHTEVMLTKVGPRLIESAPRICGGPVIHFAKTATGSSQADKLIEVYRDKKILNKEYNFKQCVMPVFLKSLVEGYLLNIEIFESTQTFTTHLASYFWFKNGDWVPKTVDYLSSFGIIALTGERDLMYMDYLKIREIESQLHLTP
jgi:biotin carboxylase